VAEAWYTLCTGVAWRGRSAVAAALARFLGHPTRVTKETMEHLTFRPLDAPVARTILAWRYEGAYAVYNPQPPDLAVAVAILTDPANAYFAAHDEAGALIGFCCFGADAQVPGGDYTDTAPLDVGLGLRPDLTGGGRGLPFLLAVLALGRERFAPPRFRLTVAAFNERAQKVYARAGFSTLARFRRGAEAGAPEFLIMIEGSQQRAQSPR